MRQLYSLNILLLSRRSGVLARSIVEAACRTSRDFPGVCFSLGYGGSSVEDIEFYQELLDATRRQGGQTQLVVEVDPTIRLNACINKTKDWTLFLSDDDEFSNNYLSAMAETTRASDSTTTLITPSEFRIYSDQKVTQLRTRVIDTDDIQKRYQQLLNSQLTNIAFYSAHRTETVQEWLRYLTHRNYFPTYSDQLLVTLSAVRGTTVLTIGQTYLLKDQSVWSSLELLIKADASHYPRTEMVLFHELLWCADMYNLLHKQEFFGAIKESHFEWWRGRLLQMKGLVVKRLNFLGIKLDGRLLIRLLKIWIAIQKRNSNQSVAALMVLANQIQSPFADSGAGLD